MGLKIGIYSTPWVMSYAGYLGGRAENPEGSKQQWEKTKPNQNILPKALGKYSFATNDAKQWAEWGIDYLKYDWNPIQAPETKEMAQALRDSGRDIVLSLSNNAPGVGGDLLKRIADIAPLAQAWRTTRDINDTWGSVKSIGFSQDVWAEFQKPGHYNDPDMLVVGHVGWGEPHPTSLTPDEQYTHITMWALLSAPLLIGCDLEKMDAFTLGLLTNDEVIDVNQDALCQPPIRLSPKGDIAVYAKKLESGDWALGLFNLSDTESKVSADWSDIKLTAPQKVRDLWRQKDLGVFEKRFEVTIPSHGAEMIRISPVQISDTNK
jgi:alpha-galactosidase